MTEPGRLLCSDCGTENEAQARFCNYCGGAVTRPWGLESDPHRAGAVRTDPTGGASRSGTRAHAAAGSRGPSAPLAAEPIPSEEETIELLELLARPSTLDPTLTQSDWTPPLANPPAGLASPSVRGGSGNAGPESPSTTVGTVPPPTNCKGAGAATALAAPPKQGVRPGSRRSSSWLRTLSWIAGATLLTGLLGYLGAVFLIKPVKEDRISAHQAPPAMAGGRLSVEVPTGLPSNSLRVTVVRANQPVKTARGELLKGVPPEKIGGVTLEPGSYIVRFLYRQTPLREVRAEIRRGQDTIIQPSRWQLADIEYTAGEAAARLGGPDQHGDSDVVHFRRTLTLDPDHINAHLQMAAYELLNGKRSDVERHLGNIRRLAPQHPDLVQLEALLKKRKRGS